MADYRFDFASKTRLTKILHAIEIKDLVSLYAAVRDSDIALRDYFAYWLINNPVPGRTVALNLLAGMSNPVSSVRAAGVHLLLSNIGRET